MALHLAFDDTDARDGMCTTWLVNRVLETFPELDLIGLPRLVRLNPNVPWKTRGNAALTLTLGRGRGEPFAVAASLPRGPRVAYRDAEPARLDAHDAFDRLAAVVERHARVDAEGTDPGFVVATARPSRELYERAVTDVVPLDEAERALADVDAVAGGLKARRGLIGAAAALAWTPRDRTFEVLAYREPERIGTPRGVEPSSLLDVQRAFPSTFDSFDETNDEVVAVPSSPCPVLVGLRGERADDLPLALARVRGEAPREWTLFETNQATDDHLADLAAADARPFRSARMRGRILEAPWRDGGHVFARFGDDAGEVTLAAYAPTLGFRDVLAAMRMGDEAVACGGLHAAPAGGVTLALEKLRLDTLVAQREKVANPRCCLRAMQSAGREAGYRCLACGSKATRSAATWRDVPREARRGWHEVPASARRHLAKPLRRLVAPALA